MRLDKVLRIATTAFYELKKGSVDSCDVVTRAEEALHIEASYRMSREEMFMEIARLLAARSTCTRKKVGALIVKDNRIISTGYCGSPSGTPHCTEIGCDLDDATGGCVRTIHAEVNAIVFAAKHGISVSGATMYTTLSPCLDCAKLIINSGIESISVGGLYRSNAGTALLAGLGRKVLYLLPEDNL